ncbi:uncharacterized protein VTP21DRAFT_8786 [Calcarisporiella thermophila]|uniref:uncharacterized protein n=1 Tax=Calcarisporiella thermophila TaxID=911321 RepID=UPI003742006A
MAFSFLWNRTSTTSTDSHQNGPSPNDSLNPPDHCETEQTIVAEQEPDQPQQANGAPVREEDTVMANTSHDVIPATATPNGEEKNDDISSTKAPPMASAQSGLAWFWWHRHSSRISPLQLSSTSSERLLPEQHKEEAGKGIIKGAEEQGKELPQGSHNQHNPVPAPEPNHSLTKQSSSASLLTAFLAHKPISDISSVPSLPIGRVSATPYSAEPSQSMNNTPVPFSSSPAKRNRSGSGSSVSSWMSRSKGIAEISNTSAAGNVVSKTATFSTSVAQLKEKIRVVEDDALSVRSGRSVEKPIEATPTASTQPPPAPPVDASQGKPEQSTDDIPAVPAQQTRGSWVWGWKGSIAGNEVTETVVTTDASLTLETSGQKRQDNTTTTTAETTVMESQAETSTTEAEDQQALEESSHWWQLSFFSRRSVTATAHIEQQADAQSVATTSTTEPINKAEMADTSSNKTQSLAEANRPLVAPTIGWFGSGLRAGANQKNVVLPRFEDQFPNARRAQPNTLVQYAFHAVNGLFAGREGKLSRYLGGMTRTDLDKKYAVLAVHGWFPHKLVRSVLGEPTGTSARFAFNFKRALANYFRDHYGVAIPDHSISQIPLEGEGKVEDRVQLLKRNLYQNETWCRNLLEADVVFIVAHSQGTPVSALLVEQLIEERKIQPARQQMCFLAMAGIGHGPFISLKSNLFVKYFEGEAARELFDFMDFSTDISQKFLHALDVMLRANIKIVLVGSMQDQVVPLYSAIIHGIDHPAILRAVYIDAHIYQADFLTGLIVFALRLRNNGISDHGLLLHLSEALGGSIYSDQAHSTIYEELEVYSLAVRYLLEGPTPSHHNLGLRAGEFRVRSRNNPFYLPWAMRGIMDDRKILGDDELRQELERLQAQYEDWQPTGRLQEVKFRLEPIQAISP